MTIPSKILKSVSFSNGNVLSPIIVNHSVIFKESYENHDFLHTKIKYEKFKCQICSDFKILSMLLDHQGSYAKITCFLCEWCSQTKHQQRIREEWPARKDLNPG